MSTRTSDFDLIVGADIQASADQLVKDIETAIKLVNGTPRKIKLELDDSLIKTQLTSIKDQIAALNGQKIEIKAGSEFGNIIKASGTLSESIKKASTNIKTLSDEFRKLASNSGAGNIVNDLQQVTPVIEGLKSEIASLQTAMSGFKGVSFNLGGNTNPIARGGQAARQTISELKTQARELEKVFESLFSDKKSHGAEALFRVVQGTNFVSENNVINKLHEIRNPDLSLSAQMDAWRNYIQLYQKAASIKGVDISSVTASFSQSADAMIEKTRKIQSGEVELEEATERLKTIFGSGIDAGKLTVQLDAINESINKVITTIQSLGENGQSVNSFVSAMTSATQTISEFLTKLDTMSQARIGVDTTSINQVRQQISETVAQVANEADTEKVKFQAITDSISAGITEVDIKTKQLAESARTAGAELNTIKLEVPVSDTGRIQKALMLEGVDSNMANKIAEDVVNLSGRVKELSGTWREFGDEGARVASVTVKSLDEMNNVTSRTIQYQRQLNEAGESTWVSTQSGSFKVAIDRAKEYESLLKKIIETTTKARDFVSKNSEASTTKSYEGMIATVEELEGVVNSCEKDFTRLEGTIASSAFKGIAEIESATRSVELNLAEIKSSLTAAGTMGDPITAFQNQIKTATNLLNKNEALSSNESFKSLSDYVNKVTKAIELCKNESVSLDDALKKVGLDGATAFATGKRAISDFGLTVSQAGAAAKEEAAMLKNRESIQNAANSAILSGEKALRNWSAAEHSHNTESREAYAALKREVDQLKAAASGANKDAESLRNLKSATSSVNSTLKETEATLVRNGNATEKFSAKIGNLVQKFSSWFTITQVIMYTIRSIKKMVSASVELNSALTQMQIVTKASDSEMRAFSDSAAKAAKRVGSDITDFVSSATTYARLGQTMEESEWMAEYTAKLQALGEIDVSDAQDAVTSIIKAFDIDPMQIDKVMDKLIVVSNNFPINAEQISEGMTNASSALAAAGNSFEQSVALLTAANTTINLCRAA